ncbi:MAG: hypothetical protein SPI65_05365 [Peptoniphilus sp.]|nr:hypothetical protein [Peptoniphilus sp.]MDD7362612.1 hypothetical protein [Bacillota bacterium]MDY6044989.1 hypothetical protein [Peptoniphilus sp.]
MNKQTRRFLLFLCIIVAVALGIKKISVFSYKAKLMYSVKAKHEITDMDLLKGGELATFDGDRLVFYRGGAKDKKVVDRMGEGQKVFFGEKDAMLYDPNIKKLTVFTPDGRERQSYYVDGELFSAEVQRGVRILHCRYKDGEKLFIASDGGKMTSVFETKNYILDYRFDSAKQFVVTELSNTANGYETTVYVDDGQTDQARMENTEFPMEVAMRIVKTGYPVVVTEKHIYGIDDELKTQTTSIISDIVAHNGKIYTLHSGILSVYDGALNENKRYVMEANVDRLASMKQGLFAYGNREILGRPHTDRPYHIRFSAGQEKLFIKDGYIVAYQHKRIGVYKLKLDLFGKSSRIQEIKNED